jgi:predicted hotdog family 3-hydroxylacyl-ACP dehydratase
MNISEDILLFIPQRHPFVMIDKLLFVDDAHARTAFTIKAENILCEDGMLSEAGLLENIAQTAAAGAGYNSIKNNKAVSMGYIVAVKNFEIFVLPNIDDDLITNIVVEGQVLDFMMIAGRIFCNDKPVAQCEMRIFIEPGNNVYLS